MTQPDDDKIFIARVMCILLSVISKYDIKKDIIRDIKMTSIPAFENRSHNTQYVNWLIGKYH